MDSPVDGRINSLERTKHRLDGRHGKQLKAAIEGQHIKGHAWLEAHLFPDIRGNRELEILVERHSVIHRREFSKNALWVAQLPRLPWRIFDYKIVFIDDLNRELVKK
jgi:hypothetical protein